MSLLPKQGIRPFMSFGSIDRIDVGEHWSQTTVNLVLDFVGCAIIVDRGRLARSLGEDGASHMRNPVDAIVDQAAASA